MCQNVRLDQEVRNQTTNLKTGTAIANVRSESTTNQLNSRINKVRNSNFLYSGGAGVATIAGFVSYC